MPLLTELPSLSWTAMPPEGTDATDAVAAASRKVAFERLLKAMRSSPEVVAEKAPSFSTAYVVEAFDLGLVLTVSHHGDFEALHVPLLTERPSLSWTVGPPEGIDITDTAAVASLKVACERSLKAMRSSPEVLVEKAPSFSTAFVDDAFDFRQVSKVSHHGGFEALQMCPSRPSARRSVGR